MVEESGVELKVGPLSGVTVLELGSFIAGPFAGQLLGDYGADVIKVEPPRTGDPMRRWGVTKDGHSLWWPTIARNKQSICVDLHDPRGLEVIRRLAMKSDIIIENFRPGRLEDWGLGYDELKESNPGLILVHVSGYGQNGPKARSAGFGSIGEAVGGIRYTTGIPGHPSSRTGISLGDALAAVFAVIGALGALVEVRQSGKGQEVDVAIYEAVAALMESTLADLELGGVRRERNGSILPGVAPSNAYPTLDGVDVLIAGNADSVFNRLCAVMGRPELTTDERFATHEARGRHMAEIDEIISAWTVQHHSEALVALLEENGVPAGMIYSAEEMLIDPHYIAREMVQRHVSFQGWSVPMSGIVPKFARTPGVVRSTGPRLGANTREVLCGLGGLSELEFGELENAGVVAQGGSPTSIDHSKTTEVEPENHEYRRLS